MERSGKSIGHPETLPIANTTNSNEHNAMFAPKHPSEQREHTPLGVFAVRMFAGEETSKMTDKISAEGDA